LENEKALALLLGAHDTIEKALKHFKGVPQKDEESNDQSSDAATEHDSTDTDEKFKKEFIQPKLQDFGNPFNNFLIAHNFDNKSPYVSGHGSSSAPITPFNSTPTIHNPQPISTFSQPSYTTPTQPFSPFAQSQPSNPFSAVNPYSNPQPVNWTNFQTNPFSNVPPQNTSQYGLTNNSPFTSSGMGTSGNVLGNTGLGSTGNVFGNTGMGNTANPFGNQTEGNQLGIRSNPGMFVTNPVNPFI